MNPLEGCDNVMLPESTVPALLVVPIKLTTRPAVVENVNWPLATDTALGWDNTLAEPDVRFPALPAQPPARGMVPDSVVPFCVSESVRPQLTMTRPVASGIRIVPPVQAPARLGPTLTATLGAVTLCLPRSEERRVGKECRL